jgi:signal transduction histidine kinase
MQDQIARINRGLLQMMRVICNMSDAYHSNQEAPSQMETREIGNFLAEIFNNAAPMIAHTGIRLQFSGLTEPVYGLIDPGKLERAVHNILSNAVKFTPEGGTIKAKLTRKGKMLYLTVEDSGSGIHESIRGSVYERYRREPALEDSRHGIGLGMVLIRSAATVHGGTVLLEQPEARGSKLTMTIAIRTSKNTLVRSPIFEVDYAGGMDHRLLELSGCLPAKLYQKDLTE